jgi:hypothetical protein
MAGPNRRGANALATEFTLLDKHDGELTKKIAIGPDGKPVSDGSACKMSRGSAHRVRIGGLDELAALIELLASNQAIALGALRDGLPDAVGILTKAKLAKGAVKDTIARTAANFVYRKGQPALVLLDYDSKGMPVPVKQTFDGAGGFWAALVTVVPALQGAGYLLRLSTSSGLHRADTGEKFPGSGGLHVYPIIADGADAVRFLKTLHARCWNAGLGWFIVGVAGQLLERSIGDRSVGAPERLVFEGPPILTAPLQQDAAARKPAVVAGDVLDSYAACPPLSLLEQDTFDRLRAQAKLRLASECASKRAAWIAARAAKLAAATGMTLAEAAIVLGKQIDGLLLAGVELEFDDPDLAGTTVADILDDPTKFDGETLADPIEGVAYGPGTAMVMIGDDGLPFIHSFAHGGSVYRLRYDIGAVRVRLARATDVAVELVRLVGMSEINAVEMSALVHETAKRGGTGVRAVQAMLKADAKARHGRQAAAAWLRATAARTDPRPQHRAPFKNDPWLPEMEVLDSVIGAVDSTMPPARDYDGDLLQVRKQPIPGMHLFVDANTEGTDEATQLPAPEQWVMAKMDKIEAAEMIERHIDYYTEGVDGNRCPVHLLTPFVKHFIRRHEGTLPLVTSFSTMPWSCRTGRCWRLPVSIVRATSSS